MPSLVATTPAVMRARRRVRKEIRTSFACCVIHAAGRGRPSRSIVRSHAVARSCLGAGHLGGMGSVGGDAGVRIGECSGPLGTGGPVGAAGEVGCSTIISRL